MVGGVKVWAGGGLDRGYRRVGWGKERVGWGCRRVVGGLEGKIGRLKAGWGCRRVGGRQAGAEGWIGLEGLPPVIFTQPFHQLPSMFCNK